MGWDDAAWCGAIRGAKRCGEVRWGEVCVCVQVVDAVETVYLLPSIVESVVYLRVCASAGAGAGAGAGAVPTLSHATSTQPRVPNLATSLRFHLVSFRVGRMLTPTGACDLETRAIQTFHNRWNHFIIVKQLVFLYVHDSLHRNVGAYSGRF